MAVEVGEEPEFADFAAFKTAVAAKSKIVGTKLSDSEAEFTGTNGKRVNIPAPTDSVGAHVTTTSLLGVIPASCRPGSAYDPTVSPAGWPLPRARPPVLCS